MRTWGGWKLHLLIDFIWKLLICSLKYPFQQICTSYIWMWVNICFVNALKAFHIKRISICFVSRYLLFESNCFVGFVKKSSKQQYDIGNKRNEIRFFLLGVSTKTYLDHNPLESWHLILFGIKSFFSLAEVTSLELTSNTMYLTI